MFRRGIVEAAPYEPFGTYDVEIDRSIAYESHTLTIWNEAGERIYVDTFMSRRDAREAINPFIRRHEQEGLTVYFGDEKFQVRPTHVCEVNGEI